MVCLWGITDSSPEKSLHSLKKWTSDPQSQFTDALDSCVQHSVSNADCINTFAVAWESEVCYSHSMLEEILTMCG